MSPWWLLLIIPSALVLGVIGSIVFLMWRFLKGMNW